MKNLNKDLENIVELYDLENKAGEIIQLNEKCIVTICMHESFIERYDDGRCVLRKEPVNTFISLGFQVTDDNESPKGYYLLNPVKEIFNEDEFYEYMIEAKSNAKRRMLGFATLLSL